MDEILHTSWEESSAIRPPLAQLRDRWEAGTAALAQRVEPLRRRLDAATAGGRRLINPLHFLAAAVVIGVAAVVGTVYTPSYVVEVDGVALGTVTSPSVFEDVVDRVESRATDILGYDYTMDGAVTYAPALTERESITPVADFETYLFDQIGEVMKSYVLTVNGQFIGFENYKVILTDPNFQQALGHTLFVVVASLVIQGPLAILFALLLNQKFKGRALIRTLIFVPYVVSEVIVGTGWSLILQTTGALNALLKKIGLGGADWISDPKIAIWTLMFIISWKYIGFAVILMIAGMQSIPEDLYEAAKVDGAGFWRQQWSITLPLLGPTIRIWAFMSIIGSLQLFDLVYIIWGQYVSSTAGTSTMATYMVREGRLANNYGYGSAVAVVIFIISLVIALTYQRFVLNRDLEGALTDEKDAKRRAKRAAKDAAKLAKANGNAAAVANEVDSQ